MVRFAFAKKASLPVAPLPEPLKADPEPTGLEALDQWLDHRRINEQDEQREQQDHRNKLIAVWAQLEPNLTKAIDLVNAKLAQHGEMRLASHSQPEFAGSDDAGYGFTCKVESIVDGRIPLIVTEDTLFVAGFYNWSERIERPIQHVAAQAVADALADGVKWAIEG